MNARITLRMDKEIVERAKMMAKERGVSLSQLTEYLYRQAANQNYKGLEKLPVAEWVDQIAEGTPQYRTRVPSKKALKEDPHNSKR